MSTGLATLKIGNLQVAPANANKEAIAKLTRAGGYLRRLSLSQGSSNVVKEGKIGPGRYMITVSADQVQDLGDNIDLAVLSYRYKALDTSGETPVANYDISSKTFQDIDRRSSVKDSGCMSGLEFLVIERSTGGLFSYFASSASAKVIAEEMIPTEDCCPVVNLTSRFKKQGKNSYHVPVLDKSSADFSNRPDDETIRKAVEAFQKGDDNGESGEVEAAAKTTRAR
jgi:hypothetical protein